MPNAFNSFIALSSFATVRPVRITFISFPTILATSSPIPLPPPVITQIFPIVFSSYNMFCIFFYYDRKKGILQANNVKILHFPLYNQTLPVLLPEYFLSILQISLYFLFYQKNLRIVLLTEIFK